MPEVIIFKERNRHPVKFLLSDFPRRTSREILIREAKPLTDRDLNIIEAKLHKPLRDPRGILLISEQNADKLILPDHRNHIALLPVKTYEMDVRHADTTLR